MNEHVSPIFADILNGFAHGITRVGPAKVSGRHLSEAPNSPAFKQIEDEANAEARAIVRHTTTRHSSGFGLGDSTRVQCSCGWRGPERHEYQGNKCQLLNADERAHRAALDSAVDGLGAV